MSNDRILIAIRIVPALVFAGAFLAFGRPPSLPIEGWTMALLAILVAAAVYRVVAVDLAGVVATAIGSKDVSDGRRRAARHGLYTMSLVTCFFVLFNLGYNGGKAFSALCLTGKVSQSGVYFFVVFLLTGLFLLSEIWHRLFGFPRGQVVRYSFDLTLAFGALLALLVADKAVQLYPLWHNLVAGMAFSLFFAAPSLLASQASRDHRNGDRS